MLNSSTISEVLKTQNYVEHLISLLAYKLMCNDRRLC